jgi:NAD(P)-dependent dehydrogenase (short-subunit alcohol dehydrogenase family)
MPRPRSLPHLEAAGRECEAAGARIHLGRVDVGVEDEVEAFARRAEERFGGIDVWVNNAGVIAYGEFLDIPSEVFAQVLETNLMGQVHDAGAALRHFRRQETGVLINVSSVWGRVSTPQAAPYVTSKNAVRALSECLRGELADAPGIHVTTLAPQAVDTPICDHGANYPGPRIRPIPPALSPDEIAAGIEACAEKPKREVDHGRAGRLLEALFVFAPALHRPHTTEGGWRMRHRSALRRAFLASAGGAAPGPAGIRVAASRRRG